MDGLDGALASYSVHTANSGMRARAARLMSDMALLHTTSCTTSCTTSMYVLVRDGWMGTITFSLLQLV